MLWTGGRARRRAGERGKGKEEEKGQVTAERTRRRGRLMKTGTPGAQRYIPDRYRDKVDLKDCSHLYVKVFSCHDSLKPQGSSLPKYHRTGTGQNLTRNFDQYGGNKNFPSRSARSSRLRRRGGQYPGGSWLSVVESHAFEQRCGEFHPKCQERSGP